MITRDFSKFPSKNYLLENFNYPSPDSEDSGLMRFSFEKLKKFGEKEDMLEIGGGPTIYQIIIPSRKVRNVVFGEYNSLNRKEIVKWLNGDKSSFNWDGHFKFSFEIEGIVPDKNMVEKRKSEVREKIRDVLPCNLYNENPFHPRKLKTFDIVSSHYCADCISDKKSDFLMFMKRISSYVKNRGILLMSFLKNAN